MEGVDGRSEVVEVVNLEGLSLRQEIEMGCSVLDIAFCEDRMYVSLDAQEGDWIVEFDYANGEWTKVDTDRWKITIKEESKAEIYWLETMRKRIGLADDE